jgi:hypothetical protein
MELDYPCAIHLLVAFDPYRGQLRTSKRLQTNVLVHYFVIEVVHKRFSHDVSYFSRDMGNYKSQKER